MLVYLTLLVQSLLSSGTHIIAKAVVRDIDPVTLTMVRSGVAALALALFMAGTGTRIRFERRDLRPILFLSFIAIPVNQYLFLTAMRYTTPTNASLLYGTTPALVLLLSRILGRERLTVVKTAGVATAFLGVMIVVFEKGLDLRSEHTFGNALLVVAVLAWALYTVLGQQLIVRYGAFTMSASTMIIGTVMFAPLGLLPALRYDYTSLTHGHIVGILYLALGTSIVAYFLWSYALGRAEASKVAIFSNLQPVLTTILAVIFLHQVITPLFLLGGTIALLGVVVTQWG